MIQSNTTSEYLSNVVSKEPSFIFEKENQKEQSINILNQSTITNPTSSTTNDMYAQIIQMLISKISNLEKNLKSKEDECE